jgi:hypothetical protein
MAALKDLKPDQVVALIRKKIREALGDAVENESTVFASHGFYYVSVPGTGLGLRTLRRASLAKFFKELKK